MALVWQWGKIVCVSVVCFGSLPHLTSEELTTLRGNPGTGSLFSEESPASASSLVCGCRKVASPSGISLFIGQLGGAGQDTQHAAPSLLLCNPIKHPTLICRKWSAGAALGSMCCSGGITGSGSAAGCKLFYWWRERCRKADEKHIHLNSKTAWPPHSLMG